MDFAWRLTTFPSVKGRQTTTCLETESSARYALSRRADLLSALVAGFGQRRVLILGDAILDEYLIGDCSRISPEAPVPVLKVNSRRTALGGAANTAANIVSLGGHATLIALIGDDDGGRELLRSASAARVDLIGVESDLPTLRKTRVVSQQQQMMRLDHEDIRHLDPSTAVRILERFNVLLESHDIVVISDYAKGFLSADLARQVISRAHELGRCVIIDPRPQHRDCYVGCDYITPNWKEARALLRLPDGDPTPEAITAVSARLREELQANVVLTLGPQGIAFCSRDGSEKFSQPTLAREVFDVSGAGDTVVAALALACASGAGHALAVEIANKAASVVVAKFGTTTVTPEEILFDPNRSRVVSRKDLATLAAMLRARSQRLVTINGSFDVLHYEHLHTLTEARRQGDVLLVGLKSDASVGADKGPNRPVVTEQLRAEMLLALRVVDYVHIFDEPNPIAFLEQLNPDVHVNGSECGGEDCIENETVRRGGGTIYIVKGIPGLSKSRLLLALQPAADLGQDVTGAAIKPVL